jgi:hypothetical protein
MGRALLTRANATTACTVEHFEGKESLGKVYVWSHRLVTPDSPT